MCFFSVFSPPLFRRYLLDKLVIHSTGIFSAAILSFKPTGQAKKSGRCGGRSFRRWRFPIHNQSPGVRRCVYHPHLYQAPQDLNYRVWRNQERNDHQRIPPRPRSTSGRLIHFLSMIFGLSPYSGATRTPTGLNFPLTIHQGFPGTKGRPYLLPWETAHSSRLAMNCRQFLVLPRV